MSDKTSYQLGRWVGRNPGPTLGIVAIVAIAIYAKNADPVRSSPLPVQQAAPAVAVAPQLDPRIEACGPKLDERRAQAKAAASKKQYAEAKELLEYCLPKLERDSVGHREYQAYALANDKVVEAARVAFAKAEKARKKKQGVVLGMSEQDVLDSSWGRPERVNRTTNAYGTREQWVYGGGNYLYFKNGELVSIQN